MKYPEIRKEAQDKCTQLFNDCGLFWAFSNEQFAKNKTPLKEGEKYVSIGHGGYMPKSNVDKYLDGMKSITKWKKAEIKKAKLSEEHIAYELANYECYYTGSIESAWDVLKGSYTKEQVLAVYHKNYKGWVAANGY